MMRCPLTWHPSHTGLFIRFNWCFSVAPELVSYWAPRDLHRRAAFSVCESSFIMEFNMIYLFVHDDSLTS